MLVVAALAWLGVHWKLHATRASRRRARRISQIFLIARPCQTENLESQTRPAVTCQSACTVHPLSESRSESVIILPCEAPNDHVCLRSACRMASSVSPLGGIPATLTRLIQYLEPLASGIRCPKCEPSIETHSPSGSTLTFSHTTSSSLNDAATAYMGGAVVTRSCTLNRQGEFNRRWQSHASHARLIRVETHRAIGPPELRTKVWP